jgi:AraC-like DNA-binding protein
MDGAEWTGSSGRPQQATGLAMLLERFAHDSAWQWLESLVALLHDFQCEADCSHGAIECNATYCPTTECSGRAHLAGIRQLLVERYCALLCVNAALAEELAHIRPRLTHLDRKIPDLGQPLGPGLTRWQVRRARAFIAANVAASISTSDIAATCGLSRSYFTSAFRRATGQTPHQCLLRHRIEKAKQLLLGELNIADVALTCGFADQSHLTRTFSKHTGVSPGLWRRERRESGPAAHSKRGKNPKATIALNRGPSFQVAAAGASA